MRIVDYPLKKNQWYRERHPKTHVVWHGTLGRTKFTPYKGKPGKATTSIDHWNSDASHVATPWLVDRDGTIYKTFDDREWAFHLGLKGTDGSYDKSSVGIELANELQLELDGEHLYAFNNFTENQKFTGEHIQKKWRGHEYFAEFDEAQIDAAIELTLDVCERFNIEPRFFYPSTSFKYPRCFDKATILSHSNCRKFKTDLYLDKWVWDKIKASGIQLVK